MSFCHSRGIPLFALRWQGVKKSDILQQTVDASDQHGISDEVMQAQGWGDLLSFNNLSNSYKMSKTMISLYHKQFMAAKQRAKQTGVMLAHFLAQKNSVFSGQSVTLVGYSLGAAVAKSTINRLGKLDFPDIIHNVVFLAGATYVKSDKLAYQKEVFARIVNGRLINLYTKNDQVVKIFQQLVKTNAMGRHTFYDLDEKNAACSVPCEKYYRFDNYDVSSLVDSHLIYDKCLDLLLE